MVLLELHLEDSEKIERKGFEMPKLGRLIGSRRPGEVFLFTN